MPETVQGQAAQIHLIPLSELAPGQAGAIRNQIIRGMVQDAVSKLRLQPDKLVVRDIRADTDLDYGFEDWGEKTGLTADVYETMSTGTMADQRWVGFFGVKTDAESQSVTALRFNIGGGERAIWQLQSLSEQDSYIGFCPAGIIIPPNAPYTIERWVLMASMPAHIVLKGVVVEPRGKVVSP